MEIIIPLNESNPHQRRIFWVIQGFNGIFWLIFAVVQTQHGWFSYVYGLLGAIIIIISLLSPIIDKPYVVTIDDNGIRGKISWRERINFAWDDIVHTKMEILFLIIDVKNGKSFKIDFSNMSYQNHQELKPRLHEVLKKHKLLDE